MSTRNFIAACKKRNFSLSMSESKGTLPVLLRHRNTLVNFRHAVEDTGNLERWAFSFW